MTNELLFLISCKAVTPEMSDYEKIDEPHNAFLPQSDGAPGETETFILRRSGRFKIEVAPDYM